jgi:hypothetical protein
MGEPPAATGLHARGVGVVEGRAGIGKVMWSDAQ